MKTLFTFPGQGAQKVNLLKNLPKHPIIKKVLTDASEILEQSIDKLDTEQSLLLNKNVQLTITIAACASYEYLISEGIEPDGVLGLSIGAFSATVCAGVMSFEDGLKLVNLRGQLMQEAYPEGFGMAAIIGLPTAVVSSLIKQSQQDGHNVYIANINTENQTIISGGFSSLKHMCNLARINHATKVNFLNVNVPSHCSLLDDQAEYLWEAIQKLTMKPPKITYASSSMARVLYSIDDIRQDLAYNMARQVKWWETITMLEQRGIELAIELPPGSVLTNLSKVSMQKAYCVSVETTSLDNIKTLYQRALI